MDISGFSDPWEHVRLLSDADRNEALLALLHRYAPGNRVLEVGCGTGLLSCVAAKLGARQVFAVEPTPLADLARELAHMNGLHQVTVLEDRIEALAPRPVDFAFSELLNTDPFFEGIVEAMSAARCWLGSDGVLAPSQLKVFIALTAGDGAAQDLSAALHQVQAISQTFDLRLDPLSHALQTDASNRFFAPQITPVSDAVCAWSIPLGLENAFEETQTVSISVRQECTVGGAVVWFDADYGSGIRIHNGPQTPGHWGHLVFDWTTTRVVRSGETIQVHLEVDDGEMDVWMGD